MVVTGFDALNGAVHAPTPCPPPEPPDRPDAVAPPPLPPPPPPPVAVIDVMVNVRVPVQTGVVHIVPDKEVPVQVKLESAPELPRGVPPPAPPAPTVILKV